LEGRVSNREELIAFLEMVRLKEKRLENALNGVKAGKTNKELALYCGIGVRRFLQLKAEYIKSGEVPKLNPKRRPRTKLSQEYRAFIDKAIEDSGLRNAVAIRLYISKYLKKDVPYGKVHKYLLKKSVSVRDPKKQKQRKYCRYERKHSFSLGHMDWHESKVIPGKWVTVWEDDASRLILAGGEFDNATSKNAMKIVKETKKVALDKYSALLLQLNTDQGTQFYSNINNAENERALSEFEYLLRDEGIKHILSRRNHPQTNGKEERWFRTYGENRKRFNTFEEFIAWYNDRIHLGLNKKEGVTPNEAIMNKLRPESLIGLFFRWANKK